MPILKKWMTFRMILNKKMRESKLIWMMCHKLI